MKKIVLYLSVLLTLSLYASETGGVKELNYEVGTSYTQLESNYYSDSMNNISLFASVNIEITDYIGTTIGLQGDKSKFTSYDSYFGSFNVDTDQYSLHQSVFLRDSSFGKVGISFGVTTFNTSAYDNGEKLDWNDENQYSYSLYGEYYLNDFNFQVEYKYFETGTHYGDNLFTGIEYYINKNTKLHFSKYWLNTTNNFQLALSHQPSLLDDSVELGCMYANNSSSTYYQFFISYNFSTDVSLKKRDREYR